MDGVILLGFLIGLAVAAPIWGYDSRDGFASLEYARQQAWWGGQSGHGARSSAGLAWLAPGDWSQTSRSAASEATLAEPAAVRVGALALAAD